MTWHERWERMNPEHVLERKQAQQQRQHARSAKGRAERARQGIEQLFKETPMTQDQSEQIEQLLIGWYYWAKASREFLGHSRVSPMFRGSKAELGDVHGDSDDTDARINSYNSEIVDACVGELPIPMRAAIGVHTRNKAAGASVHRHPRVAQEQQHAIYKEAKEQLCPVLIRKGLVSRV